MLRAWIAVLGLLLAIPTVRAEDIVDVLVRSQMMRADAEAELGADAPDALVIQRSWERLGRTIGTLPRLKVVVGGVYAEGIVGQMVIVGAEVASLPEGERLMMLAHEVGHIRMGHFDQLCSLYKRFIPGEVKPETTNPIKRVLSEEAHAQAHRQEFEADAWGYKVVRRMGYGLDTAISLLTERGVLPDTATHPATRRRIAQLRMLEIEAERNTHLADAAAKP